ncbi:MAG: RnfABCDGE type electron transport complex subunit B [Candidatus Fermentibacter sp.]|nr:RnfABCDGE type electron transport complex subunit B [Candidatus Fermentibacter sp.]
MTLQSIVALLSLTSQTPSASDVAYPAVLLGATGLVLGIGLAIAARKLAVKKDPLVEKLEPLLPGANCGGCGFPGCSGFAAALARGEAQPNACVAANPATVSALAGALGVEIQDSVKRIAMVRCNGGHSAGTAFGYDGPRSCASAFMVMGGEKSCRFGCLGMGDCVKACPFGAIRIGENGVPVVDAAKCTGCGKCTRTCPKRLILLWPENRQVVVACSNRDRGPTARKACAVACIACGKCEKACPVDAITVADNLASIDPEKCINCGLCATVCPTGAVVDRAPARPGAFIDNECIGCTICAKVCPVNAISGEPKSKHAVDRDKCVGCGLCAPKCPKKAIRMLGALSYTREGA